MDTSVETPQPVSTIQTRKLPEGLMEAQLGDLTVCVRESDGFFKVSMISQGRRDWSNWSATEGE